MGSVRSEDGVEPDPTLRLLEFPEIQLWTGGGDDHFALARRRVHSPSRKADSLERLSADAKADAAFLQLLDKLTWQGRNVSDRSTSPTFAPTTFAAKTGGF
jgi:hypothetical protein